MFLFLKPQAGTLSTIQLKADGVLQNDHCNSHREYGRANTCRRRSEILTAPAAHFPYKSNVQTDREHHAGNKSKRKIICRHERKNSRVRLISLPWPIRDCQEDNGGDRDA